jgi:DNA end-binding protein Ku
MARSLWKGSISFGLVNIPIQLQVATREKSIHFHMLSKDGTCRLRQKLYCPETHKEFNFGDTARGIEIAKDEYVLVDEKEVEKIKPMKGRAVEIQQFIKLGEIDPLYFDKAYYVTPDEGAGKSYKLLVAAMEETQSIAIARFVMREKEHVAALRVMGKGLVMHILHYADEVVSLDDLIPASVSDAKVPPKEVQMARQLIESMQRDLDLGEYRDEYREKLESYIKSKAKGKQTVQVSDETEEDIPPTINLMEALKKSLAGKPAGHGKRKSA